jgi:hypothetical protein
MELAPNPLDFGISSDELLGYNITQQLVNDEPTKIWKKAVIVCL